VGHSRSPRQAGLYGERFWCGVRDSPDSTPKAEGKVAAAVAQRGQLRVYLGAAPGVGKTFRMLDEAHRRRAFRGLHNEDHSGPARRWQHSLHGSPLVGGLVIQENLDFGAISTRLQQDLEQGAHSKCHHSMLSLRTCSGFRLA